MVQIIEENRRPTFGEQIGAEVANIGRQLPGIMAQRREQGREQEQNKLVARLLRGENLSEDEEGMIPADLQMKNQMMTSQRLQSALKDQKEMQEKLTPLQTALERVQRMRDIGANKRLGRGSGFLGFFGGKTAKDRGEYQQLGKSLISLATNIPIRNRLEFETLAESLYDPSLPDQEREGVLDAMERIINNSIQNLAISGFEEEKPVYEKNRERPPLTSFYE